MPLLEQWTHNEMVEMTPLLKLSSKQKVTFKIGKASSSLTWSQIKAILLDTKVKEEKEE